MVGGTVLKVKAVVTAQDKASGPIRGIVGRLGSVGSKMGGIAKEIGRAHV